MRRHKLTRRFKLFGDRAPVDSDALTNGNRRAERVTFMRADSHTNESRVLNFGHCLKIGNARLELAQRVGRMSSAAR